MPDVTVITPFFDEEATEILFAVASRGHHADIGVRTPGSAPREICVDRFPATWCHTLVDGARRSRHSGREDRLDGNHLDHQIRAFREIGLKGDASGALALPGIVGSCALAARAARFLSRFCLVESYSWHRRLSRVIDLRDP